MADERRTPEEVIAECLNDLRLRSLELSGGREADAEELIQDTLYLVWRKRESLDTGRSIRGYLFKTLENCAFARSRRRRIESNGLQRLQDDAVEGREDPELEFPLTREELRNFHLWMIYSYPKEVGRVLQGLIETDSDTGRAAKLCNISPAMVRYRRLELRDWLAENGVEESLFREWLVRVPEEHWSANPDEEDGVSSLMNAVGLLVSRWLLRGEHGVPRRRLNLGPMFRSIEFSIWLNRDSLFAWKQLYPLWQDTVETGDTRSAKWAASALAYLAKKPAIRDNHKLRESVDRFLLAQEIPTTRPE